ncbi:D-aminoacyl-tRNA deacylase [Pedobacter sp. P351]|uniref:D-aminoacyl-tRNA deacylase n=1 Tax=Pedobacter superstes TaxID=3133441 RepID=UPI0030ADB8D0
MRAVIQRVSHATCTVDGNVTGKIGTGLLILLGIEESDSTEDLIWLTQKIVHMRIFSDEQGLMNKSLNDVDGHILLIPQFTLFAQTKKGNRPGFTRAAKPEKASHYFELMKIEFDALTRNASQSGTFGADMKIELLNNGPVTIIMDTKDKENH